MRLLLLLGSCCLLGLAGSTPAGSQRAFDKLVQEQQKVQKLGSDARPKTIPFSVLERNPDYSVVMVPGSTWACTKEVVGRQEDPYKEWQTKYEGGAIEALTKKQETNTSKMFRRLFQYIVGGNKKSKTIEMSVPVTNRIEYLNDEEMSTEMCFWLGSEYTANAQAPQPNDADDVFIQTREPSIYFVKRFGGWALSNADWKSKLATLLNDVKDRDEVSDGNVFYTVSFDSPFDNGDKRRNEVWVPKKEGVSLKKNQLKRQKYETLTYMVKERTEEYELREYPAEKWACNETPDIMVGSDPMNGWQDKYDNNPYAAMSDLKWKSEDRPMNAMFMRNFKYILGVNAEGKEIKMTTPVPTYHIPTSDQMENQMMCFWLGSQYRAADAPQPRDNQVKIVNKPAFTVFVREFGGWAMSTMDFRVEHDKLKSHLESIDESFDEKVWMHLSYNSPFEPEPRRNEVWIQKL